VDNPFRPEGSLAKEAEEFVKELKIKEEKKVNELIQTSLNNSVNVSTSHNQTVLDLTTVNVSITQNTSTAAAPVNNQSPSKSNKPPSNDPISLPSTPKQPAAANNTTATTVNNNTPAPTTPASKKSAEPAAAADANKKPKKEKTKAKCGCSIS
jgi:hypothetical protein